MLLGIITRVRISFVYGTVTLCGWPSHAIPLDTGFVTLLGYSGCPVSPTTPMPQRPEPWHGIGLGYSPFARRYLESRGFFSFLQVLRCFSSLRSLPTYVGFREMNPGRFPDLGDLRVLTPARRLPEAYRSQATSFVGSGRQGIHHAPLVA